MINTITECLLDANDHAYILLSNKIEALQPSLNLAEFGQSITNIGLGLIIAAILIFIFKKPKKKDYALSNKDAKFGWIFMALFSFLVVGGFIHYQNDISEIETEIALIQKELIELEEPSASILKACGSEGVFLDASRDNEIILLKNKDNAPSTYRVAEK